MIPSRSGLAVTGVEEEEGRLTGSGLTKLRVLALVFLGLAASACGTLRQDQETRPAANLRATDPYTLESSKHLLKDFPARGDLGQLNVVVEIPTGTNAKWEVDKNSGHLLWEFKKGKPRVVPYLSYPGNYGMIPRTLLAQDQGGDGDPLDVLVLGPAVGRGQIVQARLIGVLKMLDDGEQDDKLLAVLSGSPLENVTSLEQLNRDFPGVSGIVETWFANYKGPGEIEILGFADVPEAEQLLSRAEASFPADSQ